MKLSTHNLLMCNKKTCIDNEKNYPLIIKAVKVNTVKSEFDEEKTKVLRIKIEGIDTKFLTYGNYLYDV